MVSPGMSSSPSASGRLERLRIITWADGAQHVIEQPEPVYSLTGAANPEFVTPTVRFGYTSLVTPTSTIEYDVATRCPAVVKQQPVLGGYDPEQYLTERLWARAPDGTEVPISLVCRRDVAPRRTAPCLLYGYGAYEITIDPTFSSLRLNLLERGFVFAIAHIRGGGELGPQVVRGGQAAEQAQHLHRLHRLRRAPDRQGYTRPTAWPSGAARAAGCSWGRSPT